MVANAGEAAGFPEPASLLGCARTWRADDDKHVVTARASTPDRLALDTNPETSHHEFRD